MLSEAEYQEDETKKTPHSSPWRASYGVSFVNILEEIDRVITAPYYIYSMARKIRTRLCCALFCRKNLGCSVYFGLVNDLAPAQVIYLNYSWPSFATHIHASLNSDVLKIEV